MFKSLTGLTMSEFDDAVGEKLMPVRLKWEYKPNRPGRRRGIEQGEAIL